MEKIILGGGCFWCLEAAFQTVKGVVSVTSGYAGGQSPDPKYKEVCSGSTGHAEVVEVEYDPNSITLDKILLVFWKIHDPTSLNRQGADVGTQYRSCIFYTALYQKDIIEKQINDLQLSKVYPSPIVTEVRPLDIFYPAEEYHQNYFNNNPNQSYCQIVIGPKLAKLKEVLNIIY